MKASVARSTAGARRAAARTAHAARLDGRGRRPLVDDDPAPLAGQGETAGEPRRIHATAVRRVRRGPRAPYTHALVDLRRLQQSQILLADTEGAAPLDTLVQARDLGRARRDEQRAAVQPAAVDALVCDHAPDPAHRVGHGSLAATHRVVAAQACIEVRTAREPGRGPAAVATRRAEARDFALHDGDAQVRLQRGQEVRSPEAREAGAHDGHVAVAIAGQRGALRERLGEAVEPEAARPVARFQWCAHVLAASPSRSATRVPSAEAVSSTMRVANVSRK